MSEHKFKEKMLQTIWIGSSLRNHKKAKTVADCIPRMLNWPLQHPARTVDPGYRMECRPKPRPFTVSLQHNPPGCG